MLFLFLACKSDPVDTVTQTHETGDDDTGTLVDTAPEPWVPAEQVSSACDAVRGGPSTGEDVSVDLSRAHATLRFFGTTADWLAEDAALAAILDIEGLDVGLVDAYAATMTDVCAADADEANLPEGSLTIQDGVGILVPGSTIPEIPEEVTLLAIDVRTLPATAEGNVALDAAVAAVLTADLDLGAESVRSFYGFPQMYVEGSLYTTSLENNSLGIVAAGTRDIPLTFFTGQRTSPHATVVAGALRLAGRASIVGYDLFAQVGESSWQSVGGRGLAIRTRLLSDASGEVWPDRIAADIGTSTPELALHDAAALEIEVMTGASTRAELSSYEPVPVDDKGDPMDYPEQVLTRGLRRATLLVAHGAFDRFWPYFDVASVDMDAALVTALGEADALVDDDRAEMTNVFGRFMHELYDGHGFYGDYWDDSLPDGYVAIQVQAIDGKPVVRTSDDPGFLPGDTITEVDGTDAQAWFDEAMSRRSSATDGYRFDIANREMQEVWGSRTFKVMDPDGVERDVTPTPVTDAEFYQTVWGGTLRASGFLDDLGRPDLYYFNLNGLVTTTNAQVTAAIAEWSTASGLIVDMRDYPVVNHYTVASALHAVGFVSPTFEVPLWSGADVPGLDVSNYDLSGGSWNGPTVLLVSNKTVSAAENFSEMVFQEKYVTVVGQHSAGMNGNITLMLLPGGYYAYFTGMRVLNPDGTDLYGTGIPVDVEVEPTPAEFRDGIDPELEAAVSLL